MRPFVHLNFAVDQHGRLNDTDGTILSISCPADWQRVHALRERYSGIAVGAVTWQRDTPKLTVRRGRLGREPTRQPCRVIFTGDHPCKIPPDGRPTYVIGRKHLSGLETTYIQADNRDLAQPLTQLVQMGVRSLLVEGGMTLLRSFIDQQMFDVCTVYVRVRDPDQAITPLRDLDVMTAARDVTSESLGEGVLVHWQSQSSQESGQASAVSQHPVQGSPA